MKKVWALAILAVIGWLACSMNACTHIGDPVSRSPVQYIESETGFSITLPPGWKVDISKKKERNELFSSVKDMNISVKGIPIRSEGWCSGFWVSPDGEAHVELHGSKAPVVVPAAMSFTYSPHNVYHEGYKRIGTPIIKEDNKNLYHVFTFKNGKAKERLVVRKNPSEVWFVTCVAITDKSFDRYEAEFDKMLKGFDLAEFAPTAKKNETEAKRSLKITKGPYLQNVTTASITVMWETSRKSTSLVSYKADGGSGSEPEKVESRELTKIHEITLSGLKSGALYDYKIRSQIPSESTVTSEDLRFRTAPGTSSPFTFAVYGDNRKPIWGIEKGEEWTTHEEIANAIDARNPAIVLNTGDVVTDGKKYELWGSEFFGPARELLKDTPCYISIGNHEENAHWFYNFVSYPKPENYYSFNYGAVHFIALDSNMEIGPGTEQYEWLKKDLESSSARWKIVFLHHPLYDSIHQAEKFELTLRRNLAPILEKHGVDIIFSGHSHVYERSHPVKSGAVNKESGIIYITSGGGGAELKVFAGIDRPLYIAKREAVHHYCIVDISYGKLQMNVYRIDGSLLDSLTISKPH